MGKLGRPGPAAFYVRRRLRGQAGADAGLEGSMGGYCLRAGRGAIGYISEKLERDIKGCGQKTGKRSNRISAKDRKDTSADAGPAGKERSPAVKIQEREKRKRCLRAAKRMGQTDASEEGKNNESI